MFVFLKSDSNSNCSEMNIVTLSVVIVPAENMPSFLQLHSFSLFWFHRDQVSSHRNLYGLQWLKFSFLLLPSPGSEEHARWCKCFPFRAAEGIWALESIEKALVSVASWLSTHLFSASPEASSQMCPG